MNWAESWDRKSRNVEGENDALCAKESDSKKGNGYGT